MLQTAVHVAYLLASGNSPDWTEELTGYATLGGALVAFLAAVIALLAFLGRGVQTRETRAHSYLERYNGHLHIAPRDRLHRFFTVEPDKERQRIEQWEKMAFRDQLLTVQELNFWEELSGMYNRNLVDRRIVDDYFGSEALYVWDKVDWFVRYQREVQRNAMCEFERMCKRVLYQRENLLKSPRS